MVTKSEYSAGMGLSAMRPSRPAPAIQPDLLACLFATMVPAVIMTGIFVGVGAAMLRQSPSTVLAFLYAGGIATGAVRLDVMRRYQRHPSEAWPADRPIGRIARHFALPYLAFAVCLGGFTGWAVWFGDSAVTMLAAVLVTGYAAGVSTGVASLPVVAVPAMLVSVCPVILAAACHGGVAEGSLAAMMLAFLVGAIRSTLVRYEALVSEFERCHAYARLARLDPLTGLPNRLAMDEKLAELRRSQERAAIFCVDLDGFKKINDLHGHLAGDALLVEVGRRLRHLVRSSDMVARLGGDEFMLICEAKDEKGRAVLAERIAQGISRPFSLRDRRMIVGASVGSAVLDADSDVEQVRAAADAQLYQAKRARVGEPGTARRTD